MSRAIKIAEHAGHSMKALHVICHRTQNDSWRGLHGIGNDNVYFSECWDISKIEAVALVNGVIYFHESCSQPSTFAARILDWQVYPLDPSNRDGVGFHIQRIDAPPVRWRGMIPNLKRFNGGSVSADYAHETTM